MSCLDHSSERNIDNGLKFYSIHYTLSIKIMYKMLLQNISSNERSEWPQHFNNTGF